jgi:hypothetical protein
VLAHFLGSRTLARGTAVAPDVALIPRLEFPNVVRPERRPTVVETLNEEEKEFS